MKAVIQALGGVDIVKPGRVIKLPYETRDARGFRRLVEAATFIVDKEGETLKVLVFESMGLTRRYWICQAGAIRLEFERIRVRDELSGLSLSLRAPVLVVGECRIPLAWKRSRFVLGEESVKKCCAGFECRP